jgi:hypothetical protein
MPNNSVAILIAGALVSAALLIGLMVDRYEAVGGAMVNGTAAAWRLNVRTGVMTLCMVATDPSPSSNAPVDQYRVQCK